MARKTLSTELVDFSKPWDPFVDVTLLVEGTRFHAHRSILALWSPVFSRMFTADFREKTAQQIPLPGKKANDINELLLVIYPTSAKPIDDRNFELLLHLAEEYMMTKLTEKCEAYLMDWLDSSHQHGLCLNFLEIAQNYTLKKLEMACVHKAQNISFRELRNHEAYSKINLSNYRKIMEARLENIEKELEAKEDAVWRLKSKASEAREGSQKIVSALVFKILRSPKRCGVNLEYSDFNRTSNSLQDKGNFLDCELVPWGESNDIFSKLHQSLEAMNSTSS